MPHYYCCVAGCKNDSRYPERQVKKGHIGEMSFHFFPKAEYARKHWKKQVRKGLVGFKATDYKVVCSNHFGYGKPTFSSPNPTLFLVQRDFNCQSPKKRKSYLSQYHLTSTATRSVSTESARPRLSLEMMINQ